ncbi:MAG: FkbM family methyltransferase [Planctomycetaceae bacterium]|nr:FkbM family methyltransferase [Planctomycetaceae bacterium]
MFLKRQTIRAKKLVFVAAHPMCWRPLRLGVAPAIEHHQVLKQISVDGIIDVGANRGQFSLECRVLKPGIPIVAFEPIPAMAQIYRQVHEGCRHVELIESALGESPGTAVLHVSREADSSSILPIGQQQSQLFPNTHEVGTLSVSVNRLDDYADRWRDKAKLMLKIDVQGFELSVLRGAVETLQKCRFVYVECSEVELYEGQALRREVNQFLEENGFVEHGVFNRHVHGGKLIQADYLFTKR